MVKIVVNKTKQDKPLGTQRYTEKPCSTFSLCESLWPPRSAQYVLGSTRDFDGASHTTNTTCATQTGVNKGVINKVNEGVNGSVNKGVDDGV